jgi:hypothetical protein
MLKCRVNKAPSFGVIEPSYGTRVSLGSFDPSTSASSFPSTFQATDVYGLPRKVAKPCTIAIGLRQLMGTKQCKAKPTYINPGKCYPITPGRDTTATALMSRIGH